MFYDLLDNINDSGPLDQFIATETTIMKANFHQGFIHTWITFRDYKFSNFYDVLAKK